MNLNDLLATIATKLGTSVEHLWGVLVQQAFIDGVVTLIQFLIIGIWTVVAALITKRIIKTIMDDPYDREPWWICIILYWCVHGGFLLACLLELPILISAFYNPEYWALHHLMNMIANK